jgi:hypothetical protein
MDRRQAERIRDLQRGHFLGLGPAISRRPVAVHIGTVVTGGKNAAEGLMPLPEAKGDDLEALLHSELAEEAAEPVRPPPPPRPAPDVEQAITERAAAQAEREERGEPVATNEPCAGEDSSPGPQDGEAAVTRIVTDLAAEEGATFQSSAVLFRNFAQRCRQQGVPSAHVDMLEFRRLFAFASARLHELQSPMREAIEELAQGVPEDVLAPYLALAVAAAQGRPAPDEDELARVYGSSSPSRIRRLLEHLERQGLIVVREEFGGGRTIIVTGLEEAAAAES